MSEREKELEQALSRCYPLALAWAATYAERMMLPTDEKGVAKFHSIHQEAIDMAAKALKGVV